jgi:hypothetical protein
MVSAAHKSRKAAGGSKATSLFWTENPTLSTRGASTAERPREARGLGEQGRGMGRRRVASERPESEQGMKRGVWVWSEISQGFFRKIDTRQLIMRDR